MTNIPEEQVFVRAIKPRSRSVLFVSSENLTQTELEALQDQLTEAMPDQQMIVCNYTLNDVAHMNLHDLEALRDYIQLTILMMPTT